MRVRPEILRLICPLFAALAAACCVLPAPGRAADSPRGGGRSIGFSEPRGGELSTNLNQLTSRKDSLQQWEEEATRAIHLFKPQGSLDGEAPLPAPAPQPNVSAKRLRELMDKKKNQLWMSMEDLAPTTSEEDLLKVPQYTSDGREKKTVSAFERYYEKMGGKQTQLSGAQRDDSADDDRRPAFGDTRSSSRTPLTGELNLPGGLKDSAENLRQLFKDDRQRDMAAPAGSSRLNFSDVFGLRTDVSPQANIALRERNMNDFRAILYPDWKPPGGADIKPLDNTVDISGTKVGATAPDRAGFNQLRRDALGSPLDPVTAATAPTAPLDATVQALNQYNPPTPPSAKVEIPKVGPPRPNFEFPKRPGL
jgi:hypothetical protein